MRDFLLLTSAAATPTGTKVTATAPSRTTTRRSARPEKSKKCQRLRRPRPRFASKDDYDRAIQDYERAIQLDPKNANAYADRGLAYASKEQV